MEKITSVSIVGMGALGILYGSFFAEKLGRDKVTFLVDGERAERYRGKIVSCNGKKWEFCIRDAGEAKKEESAELLLFAVKATALEAAIETARGAVGKNTVILSVLNGISSEEMIGEALGKEHVIYCVAQGMDAVKLEDALTYTRMGELCIGIPDTEPEKEPMLAAVQQFFDETGLPYTREENILRRLWCKWMLNVGVNQTVMVTEGTYETVQKEGKARELMIAAMREVVALAEKEHIRVTEEDLWYYVNLMDTLSPQGMPSMRQDGLAKRPSEVEFFAGTVIKKAEQCGLEVPVNRELYRRVKEIEASYPSASSLNGANR